VPGAGDVGRAPSRVVAGDEEMEGDLVRRLCRSSWQNKGGRMRNSRIKSAGFKTIQRARKLKEQWKQVILTPLDVGEDTVRNSRKTSPWNDIISKTPLRSSLYVVCILVPSSKEGVIIGYFN